MPPTNSSIIHDLEVVKKGKYLGVTLADNLSWNKDVDETTKKANNTIAFLQRIISRSPSQIKAQCFTSLVRPVIEYAATAWDPYTARTFSSLKLLNLEQQDLSQATTRPKAVPGRCLLISVGVPYSREELKPG